MIASISTRFTRGFSRVLKNSSVIALAVGFAAAAPSVAHAQHGGGHGGGGGGGYHGGGHGGGGYHDGGGFHGGGYGRGWGYGGFYGGLYPGYYGFSAFDPFWYGGYDNYDAEDAYGYGPPVGYGPQYAPPPPAYAPAPPQGYAPQGYPQPGYPAQGYPQQNSGMPMDNSRGFYIWPLGIQSGSCNRPYLSQIAGSLTGASPASLRSGARLGGIAIEPVIGGKLSRSLDTIDQACATESLELASAGTPVTWQTASGIPITIQTTRAYSQPNGQSCRDFVTTAQFASVKTTQRGAACRNQNGSWQATRAG